MKRVVKFINDNRYKVILGSFLVAFFLVFLISYSFAATVPVESVEIKSENLDYDKNDPGSWKITKSAHWISKGKARITFEVNTIEKTYDRNRDIIFVVDSSASMYNGEFDQIKKDIASVLTLLKKDTKTNRVALIDFNDEARVLSDFTTDLDSISTLVNNIVPEGNTNYYQALVKVDDVLTNYKYDSSKNVSVVFLTDGFPNVDMPNEKTQYAYLKSQYSYLNVKAIQYGETEVVLSCVKDISDKQYLANKDNIENIFHRAMFGAIEYDNFQITDNINSLYFSAEKAEASLGNVDVTDGKVVWNITDSVFDSGDSAKLTIDITLKDSTGNVSLYETNSSESILSKIDSTEENINSSKTPVLASSYTVSYLGNAPAGCSVTNVPVAKKYSVFDTVGISSDIPVCFGYQFKGWKIVTKNVEKIGDNSFVMPGFDIELKATWSKLSLNKSSTGTISESATLYKVIKNEAESGGLAKEYTGEHQDSISGSGTKKIYYYHPAEAELGAEIKNKNNVIFANMCWQMIRTTDTGGVKMIYNGEPENGSCGEDRDSHVGYNDVSTLSLSDGNYYYGTDYEYNSDTATFSLSGTLSQNTWSDSTYSDLLDKYTCKATTSTSSCGVLYYVDSYVDSTSASVFEVNDISNYSVFGMVPFNLNNNSPSYVGYMYNDVYEYEIKSSNYMKLFEKATLNTDYWYSKDISWDGVNKKYTLLNPFKITSSSYRSIVGGYTLSSTDESFSSSEARYIVYADSKSYLYRTIASGTTSPSVTLYFDDEYEDYNGGYRLVNPSSFALSQWPANYNAIVGKYFNIHTTVQDLNYMISTSLTDYYYNNSDSHLSVYSEGFSYTNGKYYLDKNPVEFWAWNSQNLTSLNSAHYTCFSSSNICTNARYIYYLTADKMYYITLNSGESIDDAVKKMLYSDNVNKKNSTIKSAVDAWYKKYLGNYTSYLEDTIFCNNRSVVEYNGWSSKSLNGLSSHLTFEGYNTNKNLYCKNVTDRFSVGNEKAKLKYPVGLLTSDELDLIGNDDAMAAGTSSHLLTPYQFYTSSGSSSASYLYYDGRGFAGPQVIDQKDGVRPVISLASGTEYVSGDGSMENPYVVDTK